MSNRYRHGRANWQEGSSGSDRSSSERTREDERRELTHELSGINRWIDRQDRNLQNSIRDDSRLNDYDRRIQKLDDDYARDIAPLNRRLDTYKKDNNFKSAELVIKGKNGLNALYDSYIAKREPLVQRRETRENTIRTEHELEIAFSRDQKLQRRTEIEYNLRTEEDLRRTATPPTFEQYQEDVMRWQ